jgi:eukaryotic-like serine/threonine-protein kinase
MLIGKKLGRYEIREKIGSGGMGEVYLAHDTQLDRKVALKVLLPEFSKDEERVQRFKLEARAASALNHPNIITIHEVGEADDSLYIATEYVDGQTLREKITKGNLSVAESVRIAEQVADAIAAAHEAHVVHRDIKPENIMIRRDGYAKILDFGLAKPTLKHTPGTEEATIRMVETQAGLVMGSVRYMSPEQARGKKTDERTDVWSLGVVLYEMITGKNPFEGETVSDSLAAVIHVEPEPLDKFVQGPPAELQEIIDRAICKDAANRYAGASEMAADLKHVNYQLEHADIAENRTMHVPRVSETDGVDRINTTENPTLIHRTLSAEVESKRKTGDVEIVSGAIPSKRPGVLIPAIVLLLAVVLGVGAWWFGPRIIGKPHLAFDSVQVSRLTENGKAFTPEISPDGKYVAFVNYEDGMSGLFVRQVEADSGIQIGARTSNRIPQPTFSRDGNYIYYTLVDGGVGTVYQIPTLGLSNSAGAPKKIIADVDTKISFSPDSKQFVFARHHPNHGGDTVVICNSDGTEQTPLISTKEIGYDAIRDVAWSPDGQSILVGAYKRVGDGQQRVKLLLISLKDKTTTEIGERGWLGASSFNWLKDSSGILFVAKGEPDQSSQIWFLSFPAGVSRQITNDLSDYITLSLADDNKMMATSKVDTISSFWTYDYAGKDVRQIAAENRNNAGFSGIDAAPNGKIYYTRKVGKGVSIVEADADGTNEKQIIADGTMNFHPAMSKDGKYIIFISNRSGTERVWRANIDGSNPVRLSDEIDSRDYNPQITLDSKTVLFTRSTPDGGRSALMRVPIEGGETQALLPPDSPAQIYLRISPDGKKIAYCSINYDEKAISLDAKLIVSGFDGEKVGKVEKELPMAFGDNFEWSPDGRSLISTPVDGNTNILSYGLDGGKPKVMTEFNSGKIMSMNWSGDGRKLYIVRGIFNSDLILIKESPNS